MRPKSPGLGRLGGPGARGACGLPDGRPAVVYREHCRRRHTAAAMRSHSACPLAPLRHSLCRGAELIGYLGVLWMWESGVIAGKPLKSCAPSATDPEPRQATGDLAHSVCHRVSGTIVPPLAFDMATYLVFRERVFLGNVSGPEPLRYVVRRRVALDRSLEKTPLTRHTPGRLRRAPRPRGLRHHPDEALGRRRADSRDRRAAPAPRPRPIPHAMGQGVFQPVFGCHAAAPPQRAVCAQGSTPRSSPP